MSMLPMRRSAADRADPATLFDDFSEYMNRMMAPHFGPPVPATTLWTPLADLVETDREYHVTVEVPGVRREDIEIDLSGHELSVSGKYLEEEDDGHIRQSTRRSGRFEYTVRLPHSVNARKCSAELKDGLLTVIAPKSAAPDQQRIEIQ